MAGDIAGAQDKYLAKVSGPDDTVGAPKFYGNFVCYGKDADGAIKKEWEQPFENIVVNQGRALILNRLFANWTSYSNGIGVFLHGASIGSANVWSQISGSQISGYGANIPAVTFATSQTAAGDAGHNFVTATATYGFTIAGTQTVSGAGILFHTSASLATNLASADCRLYCYGTFPAAQQVQSNNTLSATISISYQSA
jgi:hypothetical protein